MALVLPPPAAFRVEATASEWTSAAIPPHHAPSSSSSTSSVNALELTLDGTSSASFLAVLPSTSCHRYDRPLSPPPSPPRPGSSTSTLKHRRTRSTEERLAQLKYTAIPWLSGREEDGLNLVSAGQDETEVELLQTLSWEEEEGRRRERRSSWDKKKREKQEVHQLPPSPPTTPPASTSAFPSPSPTTASGQTFKWERSPSLATSPTKSSSPSSSFSASPPRRLAVRSNLPSLRAQLSHTGSAAVTASLPSLASPTSSLPIASSVRPSRSQPRAAARPTLEPIAIPIPSPAKRRTTPSRSKGHFSPPPSPNSPLSSGSSPSSSPTSLCSRSPNSFSKPRTARKPAVMSSSAAALYRGRSVTKKTVKDTLPLPPVSPTAPLPVSPRHSRSGATSIYTLPLSPPSLTPSPPPPPKPAHAAPTSHPAAPPPPRSSPRRGFQDLSIDPTDPELDERFQSLRLLRLRHALSVQASLASYRARSSSAPGPVLLGAGEGQGGMPTPPALPSTSSRPYSPTASIFLPASVSLLSFTTPSPPPGSASAAGGGSARAAWHREQFRLFAMGKAKALRTGGQGYWAGQGFELD
ncbi:hypothetical protein JCM11251_006152 [Rhodosporidiobolus azoricus]